MDEHAMTDTTDTTAAGTDDPAPRPDPAVPPALGSTPGRPGLVAVLGGVAAVAILASVVLGMLWAGARSDLAQANEQLASFKAAEQAQQEELDARPDVGAVVEEWLGSDDAATVSGDAESASVRIRYPDAGTNEAVGRMLDELGFSSAVQDRMGRTRALDGTQRADGDHVNVTWTYHPDDGLQMVFEVTE